MSLLYKKSFIISIGGLATSVLVFIPTLGSLQFSGLELSFIWIALLLGFFWYRSSSANVFYRYAENWVWSRSHSVNSRITCCPFLLDPFAPGNGSSAAVVWCYDYLCWYILWKCDTQVDKER